MQKFSRSLLMLSPLFVATLAYSGQSKIEINTINPVATLTYWTPERMANAIAMDLPISDSKSVKKLSFDEMNQKSKALESIIHQGVAPTYKVTPDTKQLFKPIEQHLQSKFDAGTLKANFTSQQLVPMWADFDYPYSAVGKIFFTTPSGNKTCSAFVVGKRVVVTAAHCMHSGVSGTAWYSNPVFVPSYRNGVTPYGSWPATWRALYTNWLSSGGSVPSLYDYAVFVVDDRDFGGSIKSLGDVVGALGYKTNSPVPNQAHLLGYPGNLDNGQMMHQVTAQTAMAVDPGNVEYGSDMNIGAGGGPMIQNFGPASKGSVNGTNPERNMVVGVISYGYNDTVTFGNGGVLVGAPFDSLVKFACGSKPGNC